uniref:MFS transporter n=1 Tax=Anguilla anguilla TaxID=7936 RepID=A0A0E9V4Y4_ANGAN
MNQTHWSSLWRVRWTTCASLFALDFGISSPQLRTLTSAYGLLLASVF